MNNKTLLKVRALCLPDVDSPIGGVKQLHRHVEHLVGLGIDAAIVTEKRGYRPGWFESTAPSASLDECFSRGEFEPQTCVLLVPETYLTVDWHNFWGADLSCMARVVFNQNTYYSYEFLGADGEKGLKAFYDHPSVLQVLSVSENNHAFLSRNLGLADIRLSRIINAVEPIFLSDQPKQNLLHWMPRKNPDHVRAVILGMQCGGVPYNDGWKARPLNDLTHQQVADKFNAARIFLSFGHPEGFGLPIAEAMASGCWVVGYSGGGGDELFRYGASCQVAFGDWTGFLNGIQYALESFALRPRETELRLRRQALAVSSLYSQEQERASISTAWQRVFEAFAVWRQTL
jgi:glycosyltransferase involved in cell wall biosynthesis